MAIGWRAFFESIERLQTPRHFISYNLNNFHFSQKTFYEDILKTIGFRKNKKIDFFILRNLKSRFTLMICIICIKDLISTTGAKLQNWLSSTKFYVLFVKKI